MGSSSAIRMTARQFEMLGQDPPGVRLELVNGEVVGSPSPRPKHSVVLMNLAHLLDTHIRRHDLGMLLNDVDDVVGVHDVRRPDLFFFSKPRIHLVDLDQAITSAPDLCIEIISPSSDVTDRREKFQLYASFGVVNYWIVDPLEKAIDAFELKERSYQLAARVSGDGAASLPPFSDLALALKLIWPRD